MGKLISPEIKDQILEEIKKCISSEEFNAWFKSIDFIETEENIVDIPLPNVYYREWYEKYYRELITNAIRKILPEKQPQVRFCVSADFPQKKLFSDTLVLAESSFSSKSRSEFRVRQSPSSTKPDKATFSDLNPKYTFERFVVGSCNRLAHAAALAVAENPGKAYSPLFIHGGVGLGKTHLLQAICHLIRQKYPQINLRYLSCESFVNDYINAVKTSSCESFRQKYRSIDVLVIDDIHFLGVGEKYGSQEEFFHTFNALHNAQKQIVLSSDSPPKSISTLEERLVSRFKWGMVAPLDPPDFETRVAIIKKKVEYYNISFPDEGVNFIASVIDTHIRDLEGAIIKTIGYADITGRPITLDLIKEALKDLVNLQAAPVTINDIQLVISQFFNIKISELQSKKRSKTISIPRHIGIYLCRNLTPASLEEIGAAFGGKDHTTVMYAVEKIKQRIHKDKIFKSQIDFLISKIKKASTPAI